MFVFGFYCEAFVGVRPSVALFRHFFSLRFSTGALLSGCVSFVDVLNGNSILQAGKKVEGFRRHWVYLDARDTNPRLELPTELPERIHGWGSTKLTDP